MEKASAVMGRSLRYSTTNSNKSLHLGAQSTPTSTRKPGLCFLENRLLSRITHGTAPSQFPVVLSGEFFYAVPLLPPRPVQRKFQHRFRELISLRSSHTHPPPRFSGFWCADISGSHSIATATSHSPLCKTQSQPATSYLLPCLALPAWLAGPWLAGPCLAWP